MNSPTTDLLDLPWIADLALGVLDNPGETCSGLAKRGIGRDKGSNKRDLDKLCEQGWLVCRTVLKGKRSVSTYEVRDDAAESQLEELRRKRTLGLITPRLRVIAVPTRELPALASALDDEVVLARVSWIALCEDSAIGAIVALTTNGTHDDIPLLAALARNGADPRPIRIDEVVTGVEATARWLGSSSVAEHVLKEGQLG